MSETLIDDLWGDSPPRSAAKTLQGHVLRLRADLGRERADRVLLTDPNGYRLAVEASAVDAGQFEPGMFDHLLQRMRADIARRPLHDPVRHRRSGGIQLGWRFSMNAATPSR